MIGIAHSRLGSIALTKGSRMNRLVSSHGRAPSCLVACLLAFAATACEGPDTEPTEPERGVLVFDAAMLRRDGGAPIDPPDAEPGGPDAAPLPVDGGPPISRDAGGDTEQCRGSSLSCLGLFEFECDRAGGCSWRDECTGSPRSCYSQFTSYSCNRQDGCYWSYSTENCSGVARSCSSYSSQFSCTDQDGCRWDGDCSGSAFPCSYHLSRFACEDQPGCAWY